ncbi:MAG: DegV family EDD domain-containing protein [Lachnospiraceae bacterium]|nr:DegV family EDD domain-containing protein [Lachnospiraceae bacterium]
MDIRKFKEYLFDSKTDIQERLFMLITFTAMSGMVASFFVSIFNGENMEGVLSMMVAFIFFCAVVYFGYKHNKLRLTSNIVAVMMVFFFFPVVFFTSGGVYGGTPIWFVFVMLYVGMILRGRWRVVMLLSQIVVTAVCYYLQYRYPELILSHTESEFYWDSFGSFVVCSLIMTLMTSVQVFMLRRETRIVKKQKEEIDDLNKAQNRFFSSMSHEIRTPINTIIGLNEMILREDVSDEVREDARNIQGASRMLLSLINDILDMSKIQSGQMKLNNVNYGTAEMISEVSSMIQIKAMEKDLTFDVNIAQDLPAELNGDEMRIKQVLINILNNAVKYTREGGVSLTVQCENLFDNKVYLIFTVTDTGIGIKKESIPYLFTAFKRVDEDVNRHIEGTGLGLSIVKELTELMGGRVTVNSIYTQGSTFIVEIPQDVIDPSPVERLDMLGNHEIRKNSVYHQSFEAPEAKVLAVDDTSANLMVIRKLLRETKVILDTVSSGKEALEKTLNTEYNVIFMDHLMPEMDGIECMKRIKEQLGGQSREAKIVALTANADEKSRKLYEKSGFDGYVLKPVSGNILEQELKKMLPRDLIKYELTDENILEESVSWIKKGRKRANIKVTVSSVADMPKALTDQFDIGVIPLKIETEGGVFKDGVDMDSDAMLSYVGTRGKKARILPIEASDFEDFFAAKLKQGNNIIHISGSGKVADTSYFSALDAASNFDNVTIVDSGHISSGQGLMAIEACRMAEEGMKVDEIIERLDQEKYHIHTSFIVDHVDSMVASGQISPGIASVISAFLIRPVFEIRNGRMKVTKFYMGSREHAWKRYISSTLKDTGIIDKKILFITHAGVPKDELDLIKKEATKRVDFEEIYITKGSPAIAVNVGVGTFGLIFRMKERDEY